MAGQLVASIDLFPTVTVTFCILLSGILLAAFFLGGQAERRQKKGAFGRRRQCLYAIHRPPTGIQPRWELPRAVGIFPDICSYFFSISGKIPAGSRAAPWLALAGSQPAGRAAFPSSKGSWVSLNDGAPLQRLRGTAGISWEMLGSVLKRAGNRDGNLERSDGFRQFPKLCGFSQTWKPFLEVYFGVFWYVTFTFGPS